MSERWESIRWNAFLVERCLRLQICTGSPIAPTSCSIAEECDEMNASMRFHRHVQVGREKLLDWVVVSRIQFLGFRTMYLGKIKRCSLCTPSNIRERYRQFTLQFIAIYARDALLDHYFAKSGPSPMAKIDSATDPITTTTLHVPRQLQPCKVVKILFRL